MAPRAARRAAQRAASSAPPTLVLELSRPDAPVPSGDGRTMVHPDGWRYATIDGFLRGCDELLVDAICTVVLLNHGTAPPKAAADKLTPVDCDCTDDEGCRFHAELYVFQLLLGLKPDVESQTLLEIIRAMWSVLADQDTGVLTKARAKAVLKAMRGGARW